MMTAKSEVTIRKIDSLAEMDACVALQREVWQFPDIDLVPRRMFIVARSVGGQIFGAWDGDRLVGYALAVVGVREGKPYLHSHMLAVDPAYRDRGIGYRLKVAQREEALSRGIALIEWTFDPMQVKNARFNIEKLGAIVRRYTPDFYGHSDSPMHRALPTDRLHAEWWLESDRVRCVLAGSALPEIPIQRTITVTNPGTPGGGTLRAPDRAELQSLLRVRGEFLEAFSAGLSVVRFRAGAEPAYLMGNWERGGEGMEHHED